VPGEGRLYDVVAAAQPAPTASPDNRLARSVPDALGILSQLSARGVRFALGGSACDWNDPFGRMFLQILAVIAEFEANLIRQRTREGMAIAGQDGKLRGKPPALKPAQDREIRRMHDSGDYNIAQIELRSFGVDDDVPAQQHAGGRPARRAGVRPAG